jgi:hypothetical protein
MQTTQDNLKLASSGLLMMSESDYPFTYFSAMEENLDEDVIKQISGKPQSAIETIGVDYLFRNMIKVYPEASEQEKESVEKYKNLISILKNELSSLMVYRIGEIEVDVYIAGISNEGIIEGLKTKLIET